MVQVSKKMRSDTWDQIFFTFKDIFCYRSFSVTGHVSVQAVYMPSCVPSALNMKSHKTKMR